MHRSHLKYIFLTLVLLSQINTFSKDRIFRAITMDDGLSNFIVNSFYKDSIGFVWIGTDNCLDRFDGVSIKHFQFNTKDISKCIVTSICESTKGQIWAGNLIGIWRLNQESNSLELFRKEEIDCAVLSIKWDSNRKNLYVGTEKGLFIVNDQRVDYVALNNNILSPSNKVTGIYISNNGVVWLATMSGLASYNPDTKGKSFYVNKTSKESNSFHKITGIGNVLYLGTLNSGIIKFDIMKSEFGRFVDVGCNIIKDISSDGNDKIYVATDGNGVHILSHAEQREIESIRYDSKVKNGIRSNSVYSLLVDKSGVFWLGYYQAGLDYSLHQIPIFNIYAFPPYFDSHDMHVRTFLIRDNEKLIGTKEGLFYIKEKINQVSKISKNVLGSNLVLSLKYYKGEYYIGTYGGGMSILNPTTLKVRRLNSNMTLNKGHVFHLEEDVNNNLWIASSGGVFMYNKENNVFKIYSNENSQLLAGNVYYVFFDSTNKGWIATESGLCIFDSQSQSVKSNVFPSGFFNKEIIKSIREDSKHNIYFLPDKGNIFISDLNMTKFGTLQMTKRFNGRIFMSILESHKHKFWFGCENGLISMTSKDDSYRSFGFKDGIPDPVFSADASFQDTNGVIWFGNAKGLISINPNAVIDKGNDYPVYITDFYINGHEIDSDKKNTLLSKGNISLAYHENNLKIRFVSLQYTSPTAIVYEYKLEGYENDWNLLAVGKNEVIYNDLKPGKYIFKVRTEGNIASTAKIQIEINSFFSLKFWIIVFLILLVLYLFANKMLHVYWKLMNKISSYTANEKRINDNNSGEQTEKYKSIKLSEKECKAICKELYSYFDNEKPYTHSDLKLVDLSQALNCSSHTLSYVFNQYLKKNYYDFINEYRIKEFKRMIQDDNYSKYTLAALSEKCGFSSRASFYRSIKRLTGITPNEYIKSINKSNISLDDM